jgi:hypothetical protein
VLAILKAKQLQYIEESTAYITMYLIFCIFWILHFTLTGLGFFSLPGLYVCIFFCGLLSLIDMLPGCVLHGPISIPRDSLWGSSE